MHTHMCTDHTTCRQGRTLGAQLSELKPIMLPSSVQAVVACNATAPRVCTLVLFIIVVILYHAQRHSLCDHHKYALGAGSVSRTYLS